MLRPVSLHFRLLVEMDLSTSVTDQERAGSTSKERCDG
jgi:hypothetical protein